MRYTDILTVMNKDSGQVVIQVFAPLKTEGVGPFNFIILFPQVGSIHVEDAAKMIDHVLFYAAYPDEYSIIPNPRNGETSD